MSEQSQSNSIFGGGGKAFLYRLDMFGELSRECAVTAPSVILAETEKLTTTLDEYAKVCNEGTKIVTKFSKIPKAMKKFLHVKKQRLPRKMKKKLKRRIEKQNRYLAERYDNPLFNRKVFFCYANLDLKTYIPPMRFVKT